MLTYALAQGKLTNQEFTPSVKWLLLSVLSFRSLHCWACPSWFNGSSCTSMYTHSRG